ncbi:MAG TPA: Gfo/Idh/MocA family oxidoreductase [Pyrinomonadaceae bacterium]|jgi:predicted dehydrogenase|nr:Gfo/Idh/MocA family oxidoreductase [Pyrinomonadaceae bacterium]
MKDTVGIGIIGTGFARNVQIPAFAACRNAKVVSVASGRLENARATAEQFAIGHSTADWRETVEHRNVDLVCITTPPILHCEMVLAAIAAGKHILCEKPMAMNVAEAEQMTATAVGKPILALIDHELRFQDGRKRAFEMLRDGVIGKVRHSKTIFQAPHRGDPNLPWNWWSDAEQGGGALGAINSHIIDSFQWFLDCDIASVSCQLHTNIKRRRDASGEMREVTSDDQANMLLRFRDGELTGDATGLVSVSMVEGPTYQNRMEFYGDSGAIAVDGLGELSIAKFGEREWTWIDVDLGKTIAGVPDTGFARAFATFAPVLIDTIATGDAIMPNAATFEDGLRVQRVLDAARESDLTGRVITL